MAKRPDRTPDDDATFEAAMRDVVALPGRAAHEPDPAPPRPGPAKPHAPGPAPRPAAALKPLAPGESGDVDARTLDRLRRGRLPVEARLDLHGMTQAQAHRALTAFLAGAHGGGARCILVVTGKGRVSEGGGVLRNRVPHWLNAPAIRPRILAFAPAQPRDGGAGALYVLLRRVRT